MTDDRLRHWLEAAEQPLAPDPAFAAELRQDLRAELGFTPAPPVDGVPRMASVRPRSHRAPWRLLFVAALVVAGSVGVVSVGGTVLERLADRRASVLDEVRQAGRIRIAVTPEHPQVAAPGQPAAGFDVDVARELADHLGLRGDVVLVDAADLLTGQVDASWDVALPSVATWRLDGEQFQLSSPYYRWPHRLVVAEESTATSPADLADAPICGVAGDEGLAWLRGEYGASHSAPITATLVTRASDAECFAALASGDVGALVTARLSDADLQVRSRIRVIGGPEPEPRAVAIRRSDDRDASELIVAIDGALAAMRADGTLTRVSQNRFGGADLTAP